MIGDLIPMVVMTGMFAMIFGIAYVRSKENMAMIEKGLNPRNKDVRPRPFINLKWGLLLMGSGFGLLFAYIIDNTIIKHDKSTVSHTTSITIGGHQTVEKKKIEIVLDSNRAKDTTLSATALAKNDGTNGKDDDGDDEDEHSITHIKNNDPENPALYFALVAIGGGLGLFFSYRIEKKEWLDKKIAE